MKNIIQILLVAFFMSGCAVKLSTNNLPDNITEYNDYVYGNNIVLKMKNNKCLPNAIVKTTNNETLNLILDKRCRAVSGNISINSGKTKKLTRKQLIGIRSDILTHLAQRESTIKNMNKKDNEYKNEKTPIELTGENKGITIY